MAVGDFPLNDKIVVVTGGGSGIHLAFARMAHQKGARVIIACRSLTKEAAAYLKPGLLYQKCDVAKWDDLKNLIKRSEKEFNDVPDVYIAGAGAFEPDWSNFWDDTEDERYAVLDINVAHPIKFTRLAMRALLGKDKKGVVVIMASITGYSATYTAPMYCASKHAVVGFTRSMAEADELEGVKIVAICPGFVKTSLWTPEVATRFGYNEAFAQSPEEVAQGIVSLVEKGEYGGGTIFEISKFGGTRVIPTWNISPPGGSSKNEMAEGTTPDSKVLEKTWEPIKAVFQKERGVAL